MARPPAWKHTLEEARRQALVAIDFYNRPGDRRSFADFIVHIHLAWQNLMHADRMRRKVEIFYRENDKRRTFKRNPDDSKKTWDLSQCLKHEFKDNDPIRKNIEFFIGLRNHVEHRYQDSVLVATAAEAHACIINFESELVRRFGPGASLLTSTGLVLGNPEGVEDFSGVVGDGGLGFDRVTVDGDGDVA
ncbi:hypothetical protein brsh051_23780 [Brooklawnia propionicigenes]|uniref:DUF3644 domain-containing protein n=1 Tax=Brooklawnia propionicigenes TaxID=3041175 RepID=A0AAN0KB25_9ACTN|nr:hypothetical protein brsh051_23780 [Brooklawnia sp. SH051]